MLIYNLFHLKLQDGQQGRPVFMNLN